MLLPYLNSGGLLTPRRVYIAPLKFDKDDKPSEMGTSKRSFCTECSTMLWNYHDEYPQVSSPLGLTAFDA